MKHTAKHRRIATLSLMAFAIPLCGQLREIETADLRLIFYAQDQTYLAPQLMRSFVNALEFHKRLFRYQPQGKINVLLEDFGDYSHGGADVLPTNQVNIGIAPTNFTYESSPTHERMSWLMNHELTHVVEMDGVRGNDRFFRNLFGPGPFSGKVKPQAEDPLSMAYAYLTVPRRYAPRWYHEGLAVFLETWMSGGMGRALCGYDEMVFRALVRDQSRIYDLVGLDVEGTTIDFQVGVNSYLYGARFITWLAVEQGPLKVMDWARSGEGSKANYAAQFRRVFGTSLHSAWSQWIEDERNWQRHNLESIRKFPLTSLQRLSPLTLGSVSNSFYDEKARRVYAAVRYPGPLAHLASLDPQTGLSQRLHDIDGPALLSVSSLAFDPQFQRIFFTTSNNDLRDLDVYDLASGNTSKLIKSFRAGDLAFNRETRALWAVRHANGLSSLIEIAPPYREFVEHAALPYGMDLFDLEISPDGKSIYAMAADSSGRQKLVRFLIEALMNNDAKLETLMETLHDFDFSSAASFRFAPNGEMLYGTSYLTGASNIFRFNLATRSMDILTNVETGLFWPQMLADGRLIAYEYTAKGFAPVLVRDPKPLSDVNAVKYFGQQVVERHPMVREWKLSPQPAIDLEKLTLRAGDYHPMRKLRPASLYPILQGYKDTLAYGARLDLWEGLGIASLSLSASWSPAKTLKSGERLHLGVDMHNAGWNLRANYNKADFYDLAGPTKQSLKGFEGIVTKKKHLLQGNLRVLDFEWNLAGYAGLDRLPDYQNVSTATTKFLTGGASLFYSHLRRSLGAVDDERGVKWKLIAQGNAANGSVYPRAYATFDYGFLTPLRNSPVWIRSGGGKSIGSRAEPFANFYFGGFGNNRLDRFEVSRYREYYSFPGVKLNEIGSTDFARTQVEWNLPPMRFRNLGATWLYCSWVRLTLFSGVLGGNLASSNRLAYTNAGSQLDFKIVLASYLNTTFSIGYAAAKQHGAHRSSELMLSLKLL